MTAPKALLTAFGGGTVAIIGVRAAWPGVGGAIVAVTVAAAVIGALGLHYHRNTRLADRQLAGDNLYYLGLLFTLASLIYALTQLFLFDGERSVEGRAYELIGNFGIALVSTVAGILGRILLQSAGEARVVEDGAGLSPGPPSPGAARKNDPQTAPAPSPSPLGFPEDEVMALRLALRQATDVFSHFTRMATTQSEQTIAHTQASIQKFNDEMATAANSGLREAAGAWREAAQTMHADAEQLSRRFNELVDSFNERMAEAAKSGVEEVAGAWRSAAQTLIADHERINERMRREVAEVTTRTEVAGKALLEMAESVTLSTRRMTSDVAKIGSMVENAAPASEGMVNFSDSLETARRCLGDLAMRSAEAAVGLEASAAKIVEAHREASEAQSAFAQGARERQEAFLRECEEAVSEFAERVRDGLACDGGQLLAAVEKFAADDRKQQELTARGVEEARRMSDRMSDEVEQWTGLAEHTRKSLVEVVDRLTETVRKG